MLIDLVRNNYGEMDKVAQWVEMLATKAQKPELDPQTPQQKEGTDLWKGVVWPSLVCTACLHLQHKQDAGQVILLGFFPDELGF